MSVTMDLDDEPTPGLGADGRPDPAYAAALGLRPAPLGRRSAAFALDAGIWGVLAAPAIIGAVLVVGQLAAAGGDLARLGGSATAPLIAIAVGEGATILFGIVQLVLHGRRGITVGKAAAGIRSVSVRDFGAPGFWRIVLRVLVLWGSQVVLPLIGPALMFASSSWDPQRRNRSWLDRVGGCYAVDARRALDPFDARAMRHARRVVAAGPEAEAVRLPSLASDRPHGEEFRIPAERSSSGVVSAGAPRADAWAPPPIGGAAPQAGASEASAGAAPLAPPAPAPATSPDVPVLGAPAAQPASRIVLRFDDGSSLAASAFGLMGRAPAAAPGSTAQLVPVDDPSKRISKVHAEFGADGAAFWIADRGSTNGTEVRHADGRVEELAPGVRTPLEPGTLVVIGGRSFTITREPGR